MQNLMNLFKRPFEALENIRQSKTWVDFKSIQGSEGPLHLQGEAARCTEDKFVCEAVWEVNSENKLASIKYISKG